MGTSWSVKCVLPRGVAEQSVRTRVQATLDTVIAEMSTWEPDSALSRYNSAPAGSWVALPTHALHVLRYALKIAAATGGAYDPTAGPLVNLWGFGPDGRMARPPPPVAIAEARQRVGWRRVEVEPRSGRVRQPGDIYLDFSAIAKGYAVDLIAEALAAVGVIHHLVEVGGELRGSGVKPGGQPWWVQLENPPQATAAAGHDSGAGLSETVIALHGLSVATSGDYRKYFDAAAPAGEGEGNSAVRARRYSHVVDPRTARPVCHGVVAASVVHPDCMAADALSTALMVMGSEHGMRFAAELGIAARFVRGDAAGGGELLSPAFEALAQ